MVSNSITFMVQDNYILLNTGYMCIWFMLDGMCGNIGYCEIQVTTVKLIEYHKPENSWSEIYSSVCYLASLGINDSLEIHRMKFDMIALYYGILLQLLILNN